MKAKPKSHLLLNHCNKREMNTAAYQGHYANNEVFYTIIKKEKKLHNWSELKLHLGSVSKGHKMTSHCLVHARWTAPQYLKQDRLLTQYSASRRDRSMVLCCAQGRYEEFGDGPEYQVLGLGSAFQSFLWIYVQCHHSMLQEAADLFK